MSGAASPPQQEDEVRRAAVDGSDLLELDDDDDDDSFFSDSAAKLLFKAIWAGEPLSVLRSIVKKWPGAVAGLYNVDEGANVDECALCAIHHAVRHGSPLAHVKFLYDKYPDSIRETPADDWLALHCISHRTPVDVVEFLVGTCPRALRYRGEDDSSGLPIHSAVLQAGVNVVRVLVEQYRESILAPYGWDGHFPIHLAATATTNPDQLAVVTYLARHRPASLLQRMKPEARQEKGEFNDDDDYNDRDDDDDDDGYLPIHLAASSKGKGPQQLEVVRFLAEACPESLGMTAKGGSLPVHVGVVNAGADVVQVLVGHYPESVREPDGAGRLPIHLAVTATKSPHQVEVVTYLAQQDPASLLQRTNDDDGYLPIHLAASSQERGRQQLEVVRVLAEACPESLGMTSIGGGCLPIQQAIKSNVMPCVVQLLLDLLPVSIPEASRLSLMHFAIRCFCWYTLHPTVEALAKAFPQSRRATNENGLLPIHAVLGLADRSSDKVVRYLAELDPASLLVPNPDGDLPLHLAIDRNGPYYSDGTLAEFLYECNPKAATIARRDGNLAIHCAIEQRMLRLVRLMVQRAPELSREVGAAKRTPLHIAASLPPFVSLVDDDGLPETAGLLIESWPGSLAVEDANNDLPLHVAVAHTSNDTTQLLPLFRRLRREGWALELVTILLDRVPGSIRTKGAGGKLPLHVAVSKDAPSLPLVQLLAKGRPELLDMTDRRGIRRWSLPLKRRHPYPPSTRPRHWTSFIGLCERIPSQSQHPTARRDGAPCRFNLQSPTNHQVYVPTCCEYKPCRTCTRIQFVLGFCGSRYTNWVTTTITIHSLL
jgi:ankyrin repeat protein